MTNQLAKLKLSMKFTILVILFFSVQPGLNAQDLFGLEELKLKSNEFTEYVMRAGQTLNEKMPTNLVPNTISDFEMKGADSLALVNINLKFIEYYDYLLNYQNQKGITTNNLTSIFIESLNDSPNNLDCFKDWYDTEARTIAVTLACYHSDIAVVKESCIARSIQVSIINNSNIAECFKYLEKK